MSPSRSLEDEQRHTVEAFADYQSFMMKRHESQRRVIVEASSKQKDILNGAGFLTYLEGLLSCIEANQKVLDEIIAKGKDQFQSDSSKKVENVPRIFRSCVDFALVQIVREWSACGATERDESFGLITASLCKLFPEEANRGDIKVFVPGAKLGRLPFMIATAGFNCKANEENMSYLMVANFIWNFCNRENNYRIYPWIHDLSNRGSLSDVTTPVPFPDVNPKLRPRNFRFEMLPGNFEEVVNEFDSGSLDCVVTAFFLEKNQNVIKLVEKIRGLVKKGGYWINMGSLSYSEQTTSNKISLCLPFDILKGVILDFGFEFVEERNVECSYIHSENSKTVARLESLFFICKVT